MDGHDGRGARRRPSHSSRLLQGISSVGGAADEGPRHMTTTRTNQERTIRVGMLFVGALIIGMLFIFSIGSEQKIFSRKNEYRVRLDTVSGLAEGNPVKISGVTV